MGSFYVNHTVCTEDAAAVSDSLKTHGGSALVTPAQAGSVVVFDARSDEQDFDALITKGHLWTARYWQGIS